MWLKIIGQQKPPASTQDTRVHKHLYSATGNEPWSGLQPFPQFMEKICSLIETRLWITANVITDEGIRLPKALLNFQQLLGVEEYFLQNDVPTEESPLFHSHDDHDANGQNH